MNDDNALFNELSKLHAAFMHDMSNPENAFRRQWFAGVTYGIMLALKALHRYSRRVA